jgi:hypothetical protein
MKKGILLFVIIFILYLLMLIARFHPYNYYFRKFHFPLPSLMALLMQLLVFGAVTLMTHGPTHWLTGMPKLLLVGKNKVLFLA